MAYINGKQVNFSSYILDENGYYTKDQVYSKEQTYSKDETNQLISNPNLLINGDFKINQRGLTSYSNSTPGYTVDNWRKNGYHTITVNNDGTITQTKTDTTAQRYFHQWIENYQYLLGKEITVSMKVKDGVAGRQYKLGIWDGTDLPEFVGTYSGGEEIVTATFNVPTTWEKLSVIVYPQYETVADISVTIEYIKAELGKIATPYTPRPYAEELAMCQRYYVPVKFQGGAIAAANNGTLLYPVIFTPVPMRTIPTLTLTTTPEIRGNGKSGIIPTSITAQNVVANQVQFLVQASGMTNLQVYILTNGAGSLSADMYN